MLPGYNGDALGRAHGFAEPAPAAARGAILADREPVPAPVARHERPELLGILDGDGGAKMHETAQAVGRVEEEVAEEVPRGDAEADQDRPRAERSGLRSQGLAIHLDDAGCHGG